jgi:hypothetical protein
MLARVTPIEHDNRPQNEAQLILIAPQQCPPNPLLDQTRSSDEQHRSLLRLLQPEPHELFSHYNHRARPQVMGTPSVPRLMIPDGTCKALDEQTQWYLDKLTLLQLAD